MNQPGVWLVYPKIWGKSPMQFFWGWGFLDQDLLSSVCFLSDVSLAFRFMNQSEKPFETQLAPSEWRLITHGFPWHLPLAFGVIRFR